MQQVPSKNAEIKPQIIPAKGNVFVGNDYSQQEPRTLAHLSQDPVLMENYRKDLDIYSTLVSTAYGLTYEECTKDVNPELRNQGKTLQLALSYGLGPSALASSLGIELDDAKKLMNDFKENLKSVFQYEAMVQDLCRKQGFVETIMGRKRRFPNYALDEVEVVSLGFTDIPQSLRQQIIREVTSLKKFDEWRQRIALVKSLESQHNVLIFDNKLRRNADTTQILNSIIQGRQADCLYLFFLPNQ